MLLRYCFNNDSHTKEGDLAREGFVHSIVVEGEYTECEEVHNWCVENLLEEHFKSHRGSVSYRESRSSIHFRLMYFKSSEDVFLLRLAWG
jgi:hypothetical protein